MRTVSRVPHSGELLKQINSPCSSPLNLPDRVNLCLSPPQETRNKKRLAIMAERNDCVLIALQLKIARKLSIIKLKEIIRNQTEISIAYTLSLLYLTAPKAAL
jgi:hypothetical protein